MSRPCKIQMGTHSLKGLCTLLSLAAVLLMRHALPAQDRSADDLAYRAACATAAPSQRVTALQEYLDAYPAGTHTATARQLLLDAVLAQFHGDDAPVHVAASAVLASFSPGLERWTEGCRLAETLAGTTEKGADLPDAEAWARSGLAHLQEPAYRAAAVALGRHYRLPPLTARQLRTRFAQDRGACVLALAHVQLQQQHTAAVAALLREAEVLQPHAAHLFLLQGELAFALGQPERALDRLLQANAAGPLPLAWEQRELQLFQQLEGGNQAQLENRLDSIYRQSFSPSFSLAARRLPGGGHPVLLELFTGSDCLPCTGPDLAVDSLLGTYTSNDLIALELDEPIPDPDPLATPETVQRAAFYGVASTPSAFLDGDPLPILGSTREDVENIVLGFADEAESVAALPSELELQLSASRDRAGVLRGVLRLARHAVGGKPGEDTTGDASLEALRHAVIHVALVQSSLRYSGRNGVRLHRMVVRAMQDFPATAALGGTSLSIRFDPAAIAASLEAYLQAYEHDNDRFGQFQFRQTAFPLPPADLLLVAWVQDSRSHRVLNSALAAPAAE